MIEEQNSALKKYMKKQSFKTVNQTSKNAKKKQKDATTLVYSDTQAHMCSQECFKEVTVDSFKTLIVTHSQQVRCIETSVAK